MISLHRIHLSKGENNVGSVDLSHLTIEMFVMGVIFMLVTGSLFSFAILRLFQRRTKQGIIFFILSVISLISFIAYAASL